MGLFSSPAEDARKVNLKALEDARLAFLPQIQNAGTLLMTLTERGSVRAIGFIGGTPHAIIAPEFGSGDAYLLIPLNGCRYRKEPFFEASTGLGGALGIGKRGGIGFTLTLETPDGEWALPFIVRKSACLLCEPKRNPMLVPKRRKGNSNPAWELKPIEKRDLNRIEIWLDDFLKTL